MRMWFVLLVASLTLGSNLSSSRANELAGCPDPQLVADSLTNIEKADWQKLSVDRVISDWPAQFDELTCKGTTGRTGPERPCRILVSKERVIKGHCDVQQRRSAVHVRDDFRRIFCGMVPGEQ